MKSQETRGLLLGLLGVGGHEFGHDGGEIAIVHGCEALRLHHCGRLVSGLDHAGEHFLDLIK
mgnify:CR=1 FL=1